MKYDNKMIVENYKEQVALAKKYQERFEMQRICDEKIHRLYELKFQEQDLKMQELERKYESLERRYEMMIEQVEEIEEIEEIEEACEEACEEEYEEVEATLKQYHEDIIEQYNSEVKELKRKELKPTYNMIMLKTYEMIMEHHAQMKKNDECGEDADDSEDAKKYHAKTRELIAESSVVEFDDDDEDFLQVNLVTSNGEEYSRNMTYDKSTEEEYIRQRLCAYKEYKYPLKYVDEYFNGEYCEDLKPTVEDQKFIDSYLYNDLDTDSEYEFDEYDDDDYE